MKKLLAIGEALIDMIPSNTGRIMNVNSFIPKVGGAPLNVCGAYTKLGGFSNIITMLGNDPFGDKIVAELKEYGIGVDYIRRTNKANTSLAFVTLDENGNRDFSFYRNPGADMLMSENDIDKTWFSDAFALHFCSVSLGDFPMRKAHNKAIKYSKENGLIVSFDPNVRLPLFDDHEYLKNVIHEYIQYADILKISDEEVEFIFGNKDIEENLDYLFDQGVKLLVYTSGKDGAVAYTNNVVAHSKGIKVNAVDTTGAGDGFIGCLLYQMAKENVDLEQINILTEEQLKTYLDLSNKFCSISVTKEGAIASYPRAKEISM
ncbi:carbohydrate kinase [Holdemanella biformis]|uniref:carbohydrate kinase family protein n=1 Tax=Holdemanella biformis TaxID=1735 RepID=UPI003078C0CB